MRLFGNHVAAACAVIALGALAPLGDASAQEDTIKVGVLHSLSGAMAISETTLKDVMLIKVRLPKADGFEAVLINTAGGLAGGDMFDCAVEAGPRAAITVTTQAAERVYRPPARRR